MAKNSCRGRSFLIAAPITTAAILGACVADKYPTVHSPTKAVIQSVSNWIPSGLSGEFTTPLYPVSVPNSHVQLAFVGVVTGNPSTASPYPTGFFKLQFFGSGGPPFPNNSFDQLGGYLIVSSSWGTDPVYPNKLTSRPSGNYEVGYSGPTLKQDIAYAYARMFNTSSSSYSDALGRADLPWKYSADAGSIAGSPKTAVKNQMLWVQAYANLPEPITYSWTVNNVAQPWNSAFVYTSFPTSGLKTMTVTMTGSNGAQVAQTWLETVVCPNGLFYCP